MNNDLARITRSVVRINKGFLLEEPDTLAVEAPLQIIINGEPFSVTMRTPGHEEFLVWGFLYGEGIVERLDDIVLVPTACANAQYVRSVEVIIPSERLERLKAKERSSVSLSSCGLCGKKTLESPFDNKVQPQSLQFDLVNGLPALFERLALEQKVFAATGAVHAAGAFDERGQLLAAFEDIGRHNAVDKVAGALLAQDLVDKALILLVSGRVSYEIVQKAVRLGVPYLAAVSAASSLATATAEAAGLTLIGYSRGAGGVVYTGDANPRMTTAVKIPPSTGNIFLVKPRLS